MKQILCHEHHTATQADPGAYMNVRPATGLMGSWNFTTKPTTNQRPSGAPPG